jgi:chromate reductase
MADTIKVLGIAGSLRKESYNKLALKAAQLLAPESMKLDIFDIAGIPLFNQDEEHKPSPQVVEFKKAIHAADAILFVTPEYNYSIPGVLKNAIDAASRPYGESAWNGKPVAVMGASVGNFGTARAQYHLRQCFIFLNMYPLNQPEVMIGNASQRFDPEGNLIDDTTANLIKQLLQNLEEWTLKLRA